MSESGGRPDDDTPANTPPRGEPGEPDEHGEHRDAKTAGDASGDPYPIESDLGPDGVPADTAE